MRIKKNIITQMTQSQKEMDPLVAKRGWESR